MEFLEGKTLSKYLLEKYSKNPRGWSFTLYPPAKEDNGFFGAIVGGPDESWQLKVDSIFKPSPIMLGARMDGEPRNNLPDTISYGYRRLDRTVALELLRALAKDDTSLGSLEINKLLGPIRPVAPVVGESYAEGPFVITDRSSLGITTSQRQLEDRLSAELRSLMKKRYVAYG